MLSSHPRLARDLPKGSSLDVLDQYFVFTQLSYVGVLLSPLLEN